MKVYFILKSKKSTKGRMLYKYPFSRKRFSTLDNSDSKPEAQPHVNALRFDRILLILFIVCVVTFLLGDVFNLMRSVHLCSSQAINLTITSGLPIFAVLRRVLSQVSHCACLYFCGSVHWPRALELYEWCLHELFLQNIKVY